MDSMSKTLFRVDVSETSRDRNYWATRQGVSPETAEAIRRADLVIAPWENFREDNPALFPQGTGDIFRVLKSDLPQSRVVIAVDKAYYHEIALHAQEFRIPTIFLNAVLVATLGQILGNRIDRWLPGSSLDTAIELEVIVEGDRGKCISVKYKGPKDKIVETILTQTERCLPRVSGNEGSHNSPVSRP